MTIKMRDMKKYLFPLIGFLLNISVFGQASVGIGTTHPNAKAILDLTSTSLVFLPPRMDPVQMNNISSPPIGSMIFNTNVSSHMAYARMGYRPSILIGQYVSNNKWLPVSPGPKVLAWGIMDSSTGNENTAENVIVPIKVGSGNFFVRWFGKTNSKKWYELTLHNDVFKKDSMMLMITPIGNGSWDVAVSIGEIISGDDAKATIKFIDISRSVAEWPDIDRRRRSQFYFVLYDLRGY